MSILNENEISEINTHKGNNNNMSMSSRGMLGMSMVSNKNSANESSVKYSS